MLLLAVSFSACVKNSDSLDDAAGANQPPVNQPPDDDSTPPPVDDDPDITPPAQTDVMVFETTLYPVLRDTANFCVNCHGVTQIPAFAVANVTDAYNVITGQQKVDLVNPTNSRVYLRPAVDRHNCGGDTSCDTIAAAILQGIQDWAAQAAPANPNVQALKSETTSFANAVGVAAARIDTNVIAKFEFEEGSGDTTTDTSGVGNPIVLQLTATEWVSGGGIRTTAANSKAQASAADSDKLFNMITASGAYTVEAWIVPDNNAQDGPARIVTYSQDTAARNFTMGQAAIYYDFRNKSAATDANGSPSLEALDPQVATALTHVAMTFDPASGRKIYIDGQLSIEENAADTLDWIANQILVLGNEVTDDRAWTGVFRLVAIHDAALSGVEVMQNYDAGIGNLLSLRFDISNILNAPGNIDMIVAEVDDKGYLFAKPTYVGDVTGIDVKNIRIAVNDAVPVAAQAFRRVEMTVPQSGTELSPLGALIPVSLGAAADVFHLEFEILGGATGTSEPISPALPPPPLPDVEEPDHGVRSFSQINDAMSSLTGINQANNNIGNLYAELKGSLPTSSDLLSYGAAQQVAIQRLATGYCGEIVANNGTCDAFFGDCQIAANGKAAVADVLFDRFIGDNIATQPDRAGVTTEIVAMIDSAELNCAAGCTGAVAETALNATCAAVLSSSAVTVN